MVKTSANPGRRRDSSLKPAGKGTSSKRRSTGAERAGKENRRGSTPEAAPQKGCAVR